MKGIFKSVFFSFLLSLILIFVLSIIISTTSVSENIIKPVTMGIVVVSLMMNGYVLSKNKKQKGILYGAILGIIYMVMLYIISSFSNFNFSLNINSIIMIILGILSGAIGGILGVNF